MYRRIGFVIFIIALAGFQAFSNTKVLGVFAKPTLNAADYALFSSEFKTLTLLISLALLLMVLQLPGRPPIGSRDADKLNDPVSQLIKAETLTKRWTTVFLLVICISAALVLYVNPDGRLPWNKREKYIAIPTRTMKPLLYGKLLHTPDLIAFGSSVSFTLPADYIKDRWGVDAFNMSVSGGEPNDFLELLNFIIKTSPDQKPPSVVTIELLWSDMRPMSGAQNPLTLVPYMGFRSGTIAVLDMLDFPFQLNSVLDSIFSLLFVDSGHWHNYVIFTPDGTAHRTQDALSPAAYRKNMRKEISLQKRVLSCQKLDPAGVEYIESIVALSEQYHIAVVFYAPPVNADFYQMGGVKPARYASCRRLVDKYMEKLANQHSNVFFKDLVNYDPISKLGPQVYIDPRHLTREGSILLLEALAPEIGAALEWGNKNR